MLDQTINILQNGYDVYELRRIVRYRVFKNGEQLKGYNMVLSSEDYKLLLDDARKPIVVKCSPADKIKQKKRVRDE